MYVVQVGTLVDVSTTRYIRLSLSGPDKQCFRLSENSLKVDEFPRLVRSKGQSYNVSIEAHGMEMLERLLAVLTLHVMVSARNRHPPTFLDRKYEAEVFRYSEPRTRILAVQASDEDQEDYNKRITYVISKGYLLPIDIDPDSGVVSSRARLRESASMMQAEVTASDDGSPRLSDTVNLTIYVRDISGK